MPKILPKRWSTWFEDTVCAIPRGHDCDQNEQGSVVNSGKLSGQPATNLKRSSQHFVHDSASNSYTNTVPGENFVSRFALGLAILVPIAVWTACGGGSSNTGGNTGGGGGVTGGGQVSTPIVVSVSAGQTTSNVTLSVPAPASSPTPNATAVGADGSHAFSSGDVLHQNSTATVIVAGTALNTSMKASLSGPGDITLGALQPVTFTDKTTGISFTATVPSNAAFGARTLVLQDTKNDITTFAGGLEVVP